MTYCTECDIVHDKKACPLCLVNAEIERLESHCKDLEDQLEEMENGGK